VQYFCLKTIMYFWLSLWWHQRDGSVMVSANRSANSLICWLIFGLSPNLGLSETLSERLIQKVKWPALYTVSVWRICLDMLLGRLEVDSAVVRFECDSLRLLMLDMAIDKWCEFVKFMLAESVYKGVLDNGNFRKFLHAAGRWNFRLSKREFPVALTYSSEWTSAAFSPLCRELDTNNNYYRNYYY